MIGYQAGRDANNLGGSTFVGYQAGINSKGATEAVLGTYVGYQAGYQVFPNNSGSIYGNTVVGTQAGWAMATSSKYNTIIGHQAAYNSPNVGEGNTFIGSDIYKNETLITDLMMDTLIIGSGRQPRLQVSSSGKFQLHGYGSGTFDETTESTTITKNLGVDANGHVIETGAVYMGSTSVTFTSGAGTFTVSPVPTTIQLTLETTTPGEVLTYNGVTAGGVVTVNAQNTSGTNLNLVSRTVHYMYKV